MHNESKIKKDFMNYRKANLSMLGVKIKGNILTIIKLSFLYKSEHDSFPDYIPILTPKVPNFLFFIKIYEKINKFDDNAMIGIEPFLRR